MLFMKFYRLTVVKNRTAPIFYCFSKCQFEFEVKIKMDLVADKKYSFMPALQINYDRDITYCFLKENRQII